MIAVIGANGFTGHRVVSALRQTHNDERIVAVVRERSDRARLTSTDVEYRIADLADARALTTALHGANRIVCTASLGFGYAPNICEAIGAERRQHVVLFSSTSIFTRVPGASKEVRVQAEETIRESSFPATILRPTMIYGRPGDRNIERLLRFLRRSPVMPLVDKGVALQQPVFVDDLAHAVTQVFRRSSLTIGREYNLPGANALSFAELVRTAGYAIGRRPLLLPVPATIASVLAASWRRTGLPPDVSKEQILRVMESKAISWDPARTDFEYSPRPFARGVLDEACALGLRAPNAGGPTGCPDTVPKAPEQRG